MHLLKLLQIELFIAERAEEFLPGPLLDTASMKVMTLVAGQPRHFAALLKLIEADGALTLLLFREDWLQLVLEDVQAIDDQLCLDLQLP